MQGRQQILEYVLSCGTACGEMNSENISNCSEIQGAIVYC